MLPSDGLLPPEEGEKGDGKQTTYDKKYPSSLCSLATIKGPLYTVNDAKTFCAEFLDPDDVDYDQPKKLMEAIGKKKLLPDWLKKKKYKKKKDT